MASNPKSGTRKPRKAVDPNETKSDKFSRLASARVSKAVKAVKNIGALSGKSYEYKPAQVTAIMTYLTDAVRFVHERFSAPSEAPGVPEIKI
jgi:hypothetical protein